MVSGFPFRNEWHSHRQMLALFDIMRSIRDSQEWNRYILNWPIALNALRQLWETGRISEMKSPFWEPVRKPANK